MIILMKSKYLKLLFFIIIGTSDGKRNEGIATFHGLMVKKILYFMSTLKITLPQVWKKFFSIFKRKSLIRKTIILF